MVRLPKQREYIGTRYEPYELLTAPSEVLWPATEASINPIVAYMAGENSILIEDAGQSISCAISVLLAASILEARHNAFFCACSSAYFRIFLFCNNCKITITSNFLLLSTFF